MFVKGTKFLIVDDMNMFRQMVRQALQALEFNNMQDASDGTVALQALKDAVQANAPFQVVLCDWNMPKMKGIDLLKAVRAEVWGKDLPFIMLTAEQEKEMVLTALKEGVDAYMIKPFTVDSLNQKLKQVYDKRHPKAATPKAS